MAYPQLINADTVSAVDATAALTRSINMPSNLAAGDLIVIEYNAQDTGGGTNVNMTTNLGTFTRALNGSVPTTTNKYAVFYKWSDGTESGGSVTISHSSGATINKSIYASRRITGSHFSKTPVFGTPATGTGVFNPPPVTATWGSDDNLFIASISQARGGANAISEYPTNYTAGTGLINATHGIVGVATRNLSSDTDDPSVFTITAATGGFANFTLVVGPAPAATISDINGGSPIEFGEAGIVINLSGYGSTPNSVTATYDSGAKTLSFSNIAGNSSSITVDMEDRADGVDYPKHGDAIRVTVSNGTDSSYIDTTVVRPSGETGQTFVLPIFDVEDYFGYFWNEDGFVVEGASFDYIAADFTPDNFVLRADSGFSSTSGGVVTGWLRPATGTGADNVYYYEFTINGGTITVASGKNHYIGFGLGIGF